ncbi:MAG: cupredoxin domain-containing protein [Chloroflexi bacterium]|nr:cupredoxin domain-containing protein [Chloroflexota bacterium]
MKKHLLPVLLFAAAIIAACSGSPSAGANQITLEVSNLQYQPATMEVTAGQPVRLTMRNNDSVEHDFSIMEIPMAAMGATAEPMAGHEMGGMTADPQLHMVAAMGATNTMEFTPTKPGTYEFFCTVPGHKDAGMKGTLVVKAP